MTNRTTAPDLGRRLREAREYRGVTLAQVASATKISIAVLKALERNDFSRLPAGLFGRAFVRSIATEVGLDPEATLQEFAAQSFQNPATTALPPAERVEDGNDAFESSRRAAVTSLRLVALSVPLAALIVYAGAVGRVPRPADRAALRGTGVAKTGPAKPPSEAIVSGASASTAPGGKTAAAALSTPPTAGDGSGAEALVGERLVVTLAVIRPCRISLTIDGRDTVEGLLQVNDRRTLEVHRDLVVTASDAGAVVMTLNGVEAKQLGRSGELVTARIDVANFREYLLVR